MQHEKKKINKRNTIKPCNKMANFFRFISRHSHRQSCRRRHRRWLVGSKPHYILFANYPFFFLLHTLLQFKLLSRSHLVSIVSCPVRVDKWKDYRRHHRTRSIRTRQILSYYSTEYIFYRQIRKKKYAGKSHAEKKWRIQNDKMHSRSLVASGIFNACHISTQSRDGCAMCIATPSSPPPNGMDSCSLCANKHYIRSLSLNEPYSPVVFQLQ